jgi:transposase
MNFFTPSTEDQYYCGVDLHARSMYLCVLDAKGTILLHKNLKAEPAAFLAAIEPYRAGLVVAVECMFTWYWLSDLCSREKITFVLGHAQYMKAIHGGKAKNDRIDAHKLAVLLRGGMFPTAYVYPPKMRSTRDLLRRRMFVSRKRAALITHIKCTFAQYNLPEPEQNVSRVSQREGVAEQFADASAGRNVQLDLDMLNFYDQTLTRLEQELTVIAKDHDPGAYFRIRTVPGIGKILSLVILYEIHDISRFPTVQDFASYCRLVKPAKESAGKRLGSGGAKIGNVHLKWAFSEAAVLFLRKNESAKLYRARLIKRHGKAKSLTILAHKIARAVYYILKRKTVFEPQTFFA